MVRIDGPIRLRHDAMIRMTLTERGTDIVLDVKDVSPESVGGAITLASVIYNRLGVSGGTAWWDPATGRPLKGVQWVLDVDEKYVLTGTQLCTCTEKCCPTDQEVPA